MEVRKEVFVSLRLWDIGGQSIHSKNLQKYLSASQVVFMVYDVTNPDSFSNLNDWYESVKKYSETKLVYIVGNKIDLIELRQVSDNQHQQFIDNNNLEGGFFVSAKNGDNLLKTFYKVAAAGVNITLSPSELAYYDTVVKAHITKSNIEVEGRTAWADEIEAEDREAERRKLEGGCCSIS